MRDLLAWSFPCCTLFGISVRIHVLFPFVAIALILRAGTTEGAPPDTWLIASGLMLVLFLSVLLHELGHCFGARYVEGDAHEIMLWPLGGLASLEVPPTWHANLIATISGPLVNLLLCAITGGILAYEHVLPPFNPLWSPYERALFGFNPSGFVETPWLLWVGRGFFLNWVLFWFNIVLIGWPMDGGRIFQCLLWPKLGYRRATQMAVYAGFLTTLVIGIYAIVRDSTLALCLALFIYVNCKQQWFILEHGGEESVFGYDFSQGYTSLERETTTPPKRRRRPNFIQRWLQKRNQKRTQRETEQREAEELRMDQLLEKVQREGMQALTDEERRFLTRVSARYKNKPQ